MVTFFFILKLKAVLIGVSRVCGRKQKYLPMHGSEASGRVQGWSLAEHISARKMLLSVKTKTPGEREAKHCCPETLWLACTYWISMYLETGWKWVKIGLAKRSIKGREKKQQKPWSAFQMVYLFGSTSTELQLKKPTIFNQQVPIVLISNVQFQNCIWRKPEVCRHLITCPKATELSKIQIQVLSWACRATKMNKT